MRQEAARRAALTAKNMPATAAIPTMASMSRWKAMKEQAQALLQAMQEEMEAYREERSEQWQEGEKGTAFQEGIERVEAARAAVEEIFFE